MINMIAAITCMICCVITGGVAFYALWQTAKERKMLIELLAAKDYADYKNYQTDADRDVQHKNLFMARTEKEQARKTLNGE